MEVESIVCDVADADAVERMVDQVESTTGPPDVLVVVAGVIQVGQLEATPRAHFRDAIGVMLWGPINLATRVTPAMRERGRGRFGIVGGLQTDSCRAELASCAR